MRSVTMKKILIVLLVIALTVPLASLADSKYDGMTLTELNEESLAILKAMWATDEWESVRVPAGVYQVGVEIPAGEWTIKPYESYFAIRIGSKLDETKTDVDWDFLDVYEFVSDDVYSNGWTAVFLEGKYVVLEDAVYFQKPTKGTGFGFK
jgi:hypothetical protein